MSESLIRTFPSGATRGSAAGKYDYDGFLSPLVLRRFAEYMHRHRLQADGTIRTSDNWQKGIPPEEYRKSLWRHFVDYWALDRGWEASTSDGFEDTLCAMLFNVMGRLHVHLAGETGDWPGWERR